MEYTYGSLEGSKTVAENAPFKLIFGLKNGPLRLIIQKAVYGDLPDGPSADVTKLVAAMADNDALILAVSYDNLADPAPGKAKRIRVDYTFDTIEKFKTAEDNQILRISALNGE